LSVVRVDATFKNRKNIPTGKIAHYSIAEHGIQTCAAALLLFLTLLLNTIICRRTWYSDMLCRAAIILDPPAQYDYSLPNAMPCYPAVISASTTFRCRYLRYASECI